MRKLNTPAEEGDRSELMRRLAAARATVPHLPGKRVRRAPLSETRIRRVTAPLLTALNQCKALPVNTARGVGGRHVRPSHCCGRSPGGALADGKRPAPVMVWTAAQCGAFLDSIENDGLYARYHYEHFAALVRQVGLPPVRFHDMRHGAATMQ